MGMVATLAALVLGLLIGFATNSFNNMRSEIQHTAANIILLDRVIANVYPYRDAGVSQCGHFPVGFTISSAPTTPE